MYQSPNIHRSLAILLSVLVISFAGCKKSEGVTGNPNNPNNPKDGTVSANVAGTNWQAKYVYAVDSSGMIVILAGNGTTTNGYPVMLLAFPDNSAEGATVQFNIAQLSMFQFVEDASNSYWAEPAMGGSGSVTITRYNRSTKRIEGNFSGILKSTTPAGPSKNITNGQFAVNYRL